GATQGGESNLKTPYLKHLGSQHLALTRRRSGLKKIQDADQRRTGIEIANPRSFSKPAVSRPLQFTNRRSRTLFTSPSIKNTATIFDPPELISGSGIPVTGILPTTIPTFTNTWNNNSAATPIQMNIPARSEAVCAFWTICISSKKYNPNTTITPTNPCSSANAENMKSLCGTGRKRPWVCVPLVTPRPHSAPAPTAIFDWI